MTMTDSQAFDAILAHHRELGEGVSQRAGKLREAVAGGGGWEPAAAGLVAYLADEILSHAQAEEQSIYLSARARPELVEPVATMVDEHRKLADASERLALAETGAEAAELAGSIDSLFGSHVRKENEVILPLLRADPDVDLPAQLDQMHHLTEEARREDGAAAPVAVDPVADLASLLLDAASALADAGEGDRACRLAAGAWAVLRASRPELAVRATAKLHRLVRSVNAEPVTFTSGPRPAGPTANGGDAELDVRALAPAQRHEKIFATYSALGPGTGFVLVNDHDPKPLRYQFAAEHAGEFTWEPLEEGPRVWRVRIGRPAGAAGDGAESELDVRRFPHGQRHDVIFTTYGALAPGGGFVLVNDHDPVPLRYQFEAQHPDDYSWDYLQAGPDLWRVRIGRPVTTGGR